MAREARPGLSLAPARFGPCERSRTRPNHMGLQQLQALCKPRNRPSRVSAVRFPLTADPAFGVVGHAPAAAAIAQRAGPARPRRAL